jgi:hypothetical protein
VSTSALPSFTYDSEWVQYYNPFPSRSSSRHGSLGSTVGQATKEELIALIAECINDAHKSTKYITTVIENMVRIYMAWNIDLSLLSMPETSSAYQQNL